ncbi:hypothetical protein GDO78_006150 [Eleutherodactylus coqui]|uniref:SH3 domain-containing protein n=1 Tax=Eleutherodactylus coqui TaxID=57060 RepID=A0A8J6FMU3_ELECQ|nr:hypothetical protein GDO78_006150 [Eleutherodactylus coqui]
MLPAPWRYWSLPRHVGRRRTLGDLYTSGWGPEEKYSVIYPYTARDQDEITLDKGAIVEVIQKNLEGWWKIRYKGAEGWAPASYLKKVSADLLSQKIASGSSANSSALDLDGISRQQNHAGRDREAPSRQLPFTDFKRKSPIMRQRPPPRRDLTIPRGLNLPKPPTPPHVEEEYYTIADFQTTIHDGISFQAGLKVEVIEKNHSGWWYIQIDDKEGWAPATFIDKYKKTSSASRPNFLAPLPNEMAQLCLANASAESSSLEETSGPCRPLPEPPQNGTDSITKWKNKEQGFKSTQLNGKEQTFNSIYDEAADNEGEEKPSLPPRRESMLKTEDISERPSMPQLRVPPPKPSPSLLASGPQRQLPPKEIKKPEIKSDKGKMFQLKNEMGLECGHKVSPKELKKPMLKPVPNKPKSDQPTEKADSMIPNPFLKSKPQVRPKPMAAAAAKTEVTTENKVDISNLRSRLKPATKSQERANEQESVVNSGASDTPMYTAPYQGAAGRPLEKPESRHPYKQDDEMAREPPSKALPVPMRTADSESKPARDPPQRPVIPPRRPPPPKKLSIETNDGKAIPQREGSDAVAAATSNKPIMVPPKAKPFLPSSSMDDTKVRNSFVPKTQTPRQVDKTDVKDRALSCEVPKDCCYVAIADFDGDEETSSFKEGTVFEVQEKSTSGWWFCKVINGSPLWEGWIPSNYLRKKP